MARRAHPNLTLLALLTASGMLFAGEGLKPLAPFHLAALRGQEPQRAARVWNQMAVQKSALGLGSKDGLKEISHFTDAYGKTHVHFEQTYQGVKVWNSRLIGHMDASGAFEAPHATVQANIQLESATLVSQDRMRELLVRQLPKEGKLKRLRLEPVVFPTRYQEGIKFTSGKNGVMSLDARFSVATPKKKAPYVWAYHASVLQVNGRSLESTEFILDGLTGEVLAKWDGQSHATAPGTAAKGQGLGNFNGTVALDTLQRPDGTFTLNDITRPSQPWPTTDYWLGGYTFTGALGNQTVSFSIFGPSMDDYWYPFSNTDNTAWGDGQLWQGSYFSGTENTDTNSQTAAVDAHYAIQSTWDYYANVHKQNGMDGKGTSVMSIVHVTLNGDPMDNAFCDGANYMMAFGEGQDGQTPLTTFDIASHEYSHGVFLYTTGLGTREGRALNEANSDIHSVMARFWLWGADGKGDQIPEKVTKSPVAKDNQDPMSLFTMGAQMDPGGVPFRFLYKPSLDGLSFDAYWDGIGMINEHWSMGPASRAFYFLAQGASSDSTSLTYSEFLPSGMKGLGNDKAIKIWFNAMATKVTDPSADYYAVRNAMIESGREIDGEEGAAAVQSAFAAVNVGAPVGGVDPVRVKIPMVTDLNEYEEVGQAYDFPFRYGHTLLVPAGVPTRVPVPTLSNATKDASYTWKASGGAPFLHAGGMFVDNKDYVAYTPHFAQAYGVTAVSNQDPRQRDLMLVLTTNFDTDWDTEFDACDMAPMALAYDNWNCYWNAILLAGVENGLGDINVAAFHTAFNNVFNSPYTQK